MHLHHCHFIHYKSDVVAYHIISALFLYVCLVLLKVYCSDHTYTTIRIAVAATGREVVSAVADKLGTTDELLLIHLSSAGGKRAGRFTVDGTENFNIAYR